MERIQMLLETKANLVEIRGALGRCLDSTDVNQTTLNDDEVERFHSTTSELLRVAKLMEDSLKTISAEKVA